MGGASAGSEGGIAGYGGVGGAGVTIGGPAQCINRGLIEGGVGGTGGAGVAPGYAGGGGQGGAGVVLGGGGVILNYGLVAGGAGGAPGAGPNGVGGYGGDGADLAAGGTVLNEGTIQGGNATTNGFVAGAGISIAGAGVIVNGGASDKTATIGGGTYVGGGAAGIYAAAGSQVTVTNFGTIGGALYAIEFGSNLDTLVVEAGAVFNGQVQGGGGLLDLATGTGTVSFFGGDGDDVTVSGSMPTTTFDYFNTLEFAKGTSFAIAGAASIGAFPPISQTVVADGVLTLASTLTVQGVLQVGGRLAGAKSTVLQVDGGSATFAKKSRLAVGQVDLASGTIAVDGTLAYAGKWDQTGGMLTLPQAAFLTLTGRNLSFSGLMTETGGGTADILFRPATASTDTLNSLAIDELRVNASKTTFVVGPGGVTVNNAASLDFDDSTTGITGKSSSSLLTIDGGIAGVGNVGEGHMGLINNGAIMSQDLGAPTSALVIDTGAGENLNNNLFLANSLGGLTVVSTLTNDGVVEALTGTLTLQGAVTGTGSGEVAGGVLFAAGSFNQAVSFTATSGTLELAQSQAYTATVTGFGHGGGTFFDLNDIGFVSAGEATFSGTSTSGTLTVTDGTHTAKIAMAGNYLSSRFTCSSDGHNGVLVTDHLTASVPPPSASPLAQAMAAMGAGRATTTPIASTSQSVGENQALIGPSRGPLA